MSTKNQSRKGENRKYEFNKLIQNFTLEDVRVMHFINNDNRYIKEMMNAYQLNLDPATLFKKMKRNKVTSRHYFGKFIRDLKFNELYYNHYDSVYRQARSEYNCLEPKIYQKQSKNVKEKVKERARFLAKRKANQDLKSYNRVVQQLTV